MDAIKALLTRQSVRSFTNQIVTDEQIDQLLDVMIAAPSAGNMQPWRIFVIRDQTLKRQLARDAGNQNFIATASVVFVVCRVPEESALEYGNRGRHLYSFQDTAAMVENLLIGAHALGLGGCWVGAYKDEAVARDLECPEGVIPVAIIPIGYPVYSRQKSGRRSKQEIVKFI